MPGASRREIICIRFSWSRHVKQVCIGTLTVAKQLLSLLLYTLLPAKVCWGCPPCVSSVPAGCKQMEVVTWICMHFALCRRLERPLATFRVSYRRRGGLSVTILRCRMFSSSLQWQHPFPVLRGVSLHLQLSSLYPLAIMNVIKYGVDSRVATILLRPSLTASI